MTDDLALRCIDPHGKRGIEVGALHRPKITKAQGDIRYVDHYSTDELRERYTANQLMRPFLDEIVDVDHVIKEGDSLATAVGDEGPFDYVIASHLIEHVADPVGWLADACSILATDGVISLVVPDSRFTFDVNRATTRPYDWVDWHLRRLQAPGYGQLFDFFANVTTIDGGVDTAGLWAGTADYDGVRREDVPDPDKAAYAMCLKFQEDGEYIDVHTGVYTPTTFLDALELAVKLELVPLEVASLASTPRNTLEFFVTLRRPATFAVDDALRSIAAARHQVALADAPDTPEPEAQPEEPEPKTEDVSAKEIQLVHAKRRAVFALRRAAGAIRRRA